MNGRLRRPAAAVRHATARHAAARHAAVRHAACLRRREESNDRCFVSSLTLLMTTASGRVATPISSAPARRTLQTTKVPRVEASTSTTMEVEQPKRTFCLLASRTRRRPAAACGGGHLTIVEALMRAFARTLPSLVSCEAVAACGGGHLTIVEASKRIARILPSLVSCEAVPRQR